MERITFYRRSLRDEKGRSKLDGEMLLYSHTLMYEKCPLFCRSVKADTIDATMSEPGYM
jgi:hypothetical protein